MEERTEGWRDGGMDDENTGAEGGEKGEGLVFRLKGQHTDGSSSQGIPCHVGSHGK